MYVPWWRGCDPPPLVRCRALAGRLWGAFWVQEIGANTHGAYLIANYPLTATGTTGCTPGYTGPVILRLIR